jgi:Starch/carbohydrate-binding module (family 53)
VKGSSPIKLHEEFEEKSPQNISTGKGTTEDETEPRLGSDSSLFEEEEVEKPDLLSFLDKQITHVGGRYSSISNTILEEKQSLVESREVRSAEDEVKSDVSSKIEEQVQKDKPIIEVSATKEKPLDKQINHVGGRYSSISNTILEEKQSIVESREVKSAEDEFKSDASSKIEEQVQKDKSIIEVSATKEKPKIDPEEYRRRVQILAEKNLRNGNIYFIYPENVEANQEIEIFLNRSESALRGMPDVQIKGAFNGWRWKFFTERLRKTEFSGDWWSCKLFVPKQAYRIDFVFFDGGSVYENNNSRDFLVNVQNGMDETSFGEFLMEENQREMERMAREQAERERAEEEKRRREREEKARNADMAQAKAEVERKKEALRRGLQLAGTSSSGLWEFEPSGFSGGDRVRLFYNRSSRPLEHAQNIWLHGGYNNWCDGLSLAEKLVKSDKRDGDWWYADGTLRNIYFFSFLVSLLLTRNTVPLLLYCV